MSNLGIAGFENYHRKDELRAKTREDLKEYFRETFYHEPTKEQLELFLNFLIGREQDAQKVIDACVMTDEIEKQQRQ